MSLQGSLKDLQLADVIQLISVSGKTGKFHLRRDDRIGSIYLKDGQIVHAEVGDIKGEDAIFELALWHDGEFNFEPDVDPGAKTINKSNTNLLMEAARRTDEWRVLSRKIASLDMIPEFVIDQQGDRGQIQLNTSEWLILSKIDGKHDIRAIAAACNLAPFNICKVLYGLVTHGLISLKNPVTNSHTPTASSPAPKEYESSRPIDSSAPAARPQTAAPQLQKTSSDKENLLQLLEKIRGICNATLGKQAEAVVNKQYTKAKSGIEQGAGIGAIQDAVAQITKASSILKGPSTTKNLVDQLKALNL